MRAALIVRWKNPTSLCHVGWQFRRPKGIFSLSTLRGIILEISDLDLRQPFLASSPLPSAGWAALLPIMSNCRVDHKKPRKIHASSQPIKVSYLTTKSILWKSSALKEAVYKVHRSY